MCPNCSSYMINEVGNFKVCLLDRCVSHFIPYLLPHPFAQALQSTIYVLLLFPCFPVSLSKALGERVHPAHSSRFSGTGHSPSAVTTEQTPVLSSHLTFIQSRTSSLNDATFCGRLSLPPLTKPRYFPEVRPRCLSPG